MGFNCPKKGCTLSSSHTGPCEKPTPAADVPGQPLCGVYLGDNDGTCPQLTCIRTKGHEGLHDNVRGDDADIPRPEPALACPDCGKAHAGHWRADGTIVPCSRVASPEPTPPEDDAKGGG